MTVLERLRGEAGAAEAYPRLLGAGVDELAGALTEPGQPLWARELAAYRLGLARDPRAFEPLVLLLNHRDPPRCAAAAEALLALGDPRTARAAAALATNPLRTAYALEPVRLLTALRAPESAPALIATLGRLLSPHDPYWRVAVACVEGLGVLADPRARDVLTRAQAHPRLAVAATGALRALSGAGASPG
ncbi:adenylosuccinate lyase [Streptomyces sp. NPDC012888]|uniref:adenylosuccinate lyase n=1 Tax=Streptomyces sp. NPDC012888 TaxID=3364855 RepID=UPI0036A0F73A